MSDLVSQPWFWPAVLVVVALPVALLILTEIHASLQRRGSNFVKPVLLLRNYVLPALALLLLISQVESESVEASWSRIIATVLGFLVILFVLSGANAVLFSNAGTDTWRSRLPSIFVDLGRLVVIVISLGVLFSVVWGADVGGLFAALGVTSIVIGLALQNAVGSIIAGLLLLFEQPFQLGDWLDTASAKGRIVEVNWRAVHIDTGNGLQIVPNALLAQGSFKNLTRVQGASYSAALTLTFSTSDSPDGVVAMLVATARDLPTRVPHLEPSAVPLGEGQYRVSVPLLSPADESRTKATLLQRLWYASRRSGLHLDDAQPDTDRQRADVHRELTRVATALHVPGEDIALVESHARLVEYAAGEIVQRAGDTPDALLFIARGHVSLVVETEGGTQALIGELGPGEYFGLTALTRQQVISGAVALTETVLLAIPREAMDAVVRSHPQLARRLGDAIDLRRGLANAAIAGTEQIR
ncbi:mechanosensitive ion channel family protein [Rhodococcoides yunnanense]|uniref:mechanosensitive ion channel family protein n=1 Tax=Rhodococcoides yunnanense TaxID=278209 RepID=UPI00093314B2|nr:mechanosensitive ion channel family protein [Rhodococcus yunnanensis]